MKMYRQWFRGLIWAYNFGLARAKPRHWGKLGETVLPWPFIIYFALNSHTMNSQSTAAHETYEKLVRAARKQHSLRMAHHTLYKAYCKLFCEHLIFTNSGQIANLTLIRTEVYFCPQNQNAKNIGNFTTLLKPHNIGTHLKGDRLRWCHYFLNSSTFGWGIISILEIFSKQGRKRTSLRRAERLFTKDSESVE
jgi:hypothetical protein